MRKLKLIGIIIFTAWGGHTLYKYLSDDGRIFVSRERLPEAETVSPAPTEIPVEIVKPTDDIATIIEKSLTQGLDSMEEYFEAHKNDTVTEIKKTEDTLPEIVVVQQPKPEKKNCCKHYKAKYCVKIDHSHDNESVNEIIMRHFQ